MRLKPSNPLAFTPLPVTILSILVYLAILIPIIIVHITVPPAPSGEVDGVDVNQAWRDLQTLTSDFHPYNSKKNDEVRKWLLQRIEWILAENGVSYAFENTHGLGDHTSIRGAISDAVTVFDDLTSNLTFSAEGRLEKSGINSPGQSIYFEGSNIIVYIRGTDDDPSIWWRSKNSDGEIRPSKSSRGGVLVNAHYDSVSTGYGATDDGVGVVTMLQLLRHFTMGDNTPKQGVVLLFNNGEEDYLNGARAFTQHPISTFAHSFLNLEGAGAGGRATLFRSTDTEVTRYYKRSKHPFGTVISGDGFKRGLIRSQTDYVVFNGILGLRGLDVAFMAPRQRYHTNQDSTKYTSKDSVWHMLGMALETVKGLSDSGDTFEGPSKKRDSTVAAGQGSNGVWFDVFGAGFAVFELRTLFALSLTLLITSPLILLLILVSLQKKDKRYVFARKPAGGADTKLHGWRGFFRTPFVLGISGAATVGTALLIDRVNPHIVYSSPWAIWVIMMSVFYILSWFLLSSADFARPSALYRAYSFIWLYFLGWVILVAATVFEDRYDIAGVYPFMFYFAAVFLATAISLLELFALPRTTDLGAKEDHDDQGPSSQRSGSQNSRTLLGSAGTDQQPREAVEEEDDNDNENTPLFRGRLRSGFAHYRRGSDPETSPSKTRRTSKAYGYEQDWSAALPSWTWILQLVLVAPIVLILLGQASLLLVSAMHQTSADGNSTLTVYLAMALLTILLLLPLLPFLNRHTHHLPLPLLLILILTLLYALLSFPFSPSSRLKIYFLQTLDLDSPHNTSTVSLTGLTPYMPLILSSLSPTYNCTPTPLQAQLSICTYRAPFPNPAPGPPSSWLNFTTIHQANTTTATLSLSARNSRACRIYFTSPITSVEIVNASSPDERFPSIPDDEGVREIRLWSRTWDREWTVHVKWKGISKREGRVACLWSDANLKKNIPALEEVWGRVPSWVAVSKAMDGLVEGGRAFTL